MHFVKWEAHLSIKCENSVSAAILTLHGVVWKRRTISKFQLQNLPLSYNCIFKMHLNEGKVVALTLAIPEIIKKIPWGISPSLQMISP